MVPCFWEGKPAKITFMEQKNNVKQSNMQFRFGGFSTPHFTQVPDQLFDQLLSILNGSELKVLLYICRRTFGFKKDNDNISINQMVNGIIRKDGTRLDHGAGLSKSALLSALKSLSSKNIIKIEHRRSAEKGNEATNYRLHIQDPLGRKMDQGEVGKWTKPLGQELDQEQETVNQHTETTLAAALLDYGIDKPTVDQLVRNHDGSLISQKIDYIVFMQEEQPDLVRNPRGWLLKAIEHDYGPPTGYRPQTEREALKERAERRRKEAEETEVMRLRENKDAMRQNQLEKGKLMALAQETYQTTAVEVKLWSEVMSHLRLLASDVTYALIKDAQLLTTNDGIAIIGTVNQLSVNWLRNHLGTDLPAIFERCGQPVEGIQVVHLTPNTQ